MRASRSLSFLDLLDSGREMLKRHASDRTDVQRLVVLNHGVSAIEVLHAHLSIVDFVHNAGFVERVNGGDVGLEVYAAVDLGALDAVLEGENVSVGKRSGKEWIGWLQSGLLR